MQGVGGGGSGGGVIVEAPYKKMGVKKKKKYSMQEVMTEVGSGGPEGPSRRPKATRPPQELEVGARRAPYLLVNNTLTGPGYKLNICREFTLRHWWM